MARHVRRRTGTVAVLGFGIVGLWIVVATTLPNTLVFADHNPLVTNYMRSRASAARHVVTSKEEARHWRNLNAIAPVLVCAVVKAEDRRFFRHRGFEAGAMFRAAMRYVTGKPGAGGSTISQQLARNLYLNPARTPSRKIREFVIAERLEVTLSKRRILELYLNLVEWGADVWGADEAAAYYFGATADSVNAFEATFLAAMLAAPLRPPTGENGERVYVVQQRVLRQLASSRLIAEAESMSALYATQSWHLEMMNGLSWREALKHADAWYRHLSVAELRSGYSPDSVLASCGYDQEVASEQSRR